MAYVSICAMNSTGVGPVSDSLGVMVTQAPTAIMSGIVEVCTGDDAELTVDLSGTGPWQLVIDGDSYTANTSPFTFTVSPVSNTIYFVESVSDATSCMNTGEGSTEVILLEVPGQAGTPAGPAQVDTEDNPTSTYATSGASDASTFIWEIMPPEVYKDLEINGNECIVTWANYYNGSPTINIQVRGTNQCGNGELSEAFSVEIQNVGINEMADLLGISIYPNPNSGTFVLKMSSKGVEKVNLRIMNASGHMVYNDQNLQVNENFTTNIDISNEAEGIYIIILESDLGLYTKKIILQK